MLDIDKLTMGKDVNPKKFMQVAQEQDMTDEKMMKIAASDGNALDISAKDLENYENGLVNFDDAPEDETQTGGPKITDSTKVKQDDEGKSYITVEKKGNNCLERIIRKQYGVELNTPEGQEIATQIMSMNPQIYDAGRKGTGDVAGIAGSGTYIITGERMYLPNGEATAATDAGVVDPTASYLVTDDPQDVPEQTPSAPEVEVPKDIQKLVTGLQGALIPEDGGYADETVVTELIEAASPEQMYALDTYWSETQGVSFSEQVQSSLGVAQDNDLVTSIETKIQDGKTIAEQKAQAEIQKAYKSLPKAAQEAADIISKMLINVEEDADSQQIYSAILKLYNDKTVELDAYLQKAYGVTLADTISENLSGQDADDMVMVINARINNPTHTRTKEEMTALKTRLGDILTEESLDRDALSELLIGENVTTQAMEALDKYCRENLGTSLAAAVYANCDIEDSSVLIGWLQNYKIVPSTSKKAQATGEDLAQALGKNGDTWGINEDEVYEILGNYSNASQESLLNLNDYWAKTYGCSLIDEMQNYTEFQGQEQTDLTAAIKAKLSGKSIPRTKEQMTELKTNLSTAIESQDVTALSSLLISSNLTPDAMSALDRYCRKTYENKSLLTILQEQNLASTALIKWLESYGLE